MTAASRSLATAQRESALRERLAVSELHHQLGHDPFSRRQKPADRVFAVARLLPNFVRGLLKRNAKSLKRYWPGVENEIEARENAGLSPADSRQASYCQSNL